MQRIRGRWGAAVAAACRYSSIPPEFLAALIANESGGNEKARRFEPGVYRRLVEVKLGERPRYGQLTTEMLRAAPDERLRALATSWGLTQIMGYHVFSPVRAGAAPVGADPRVRPVPSGRPPGQAQGPAPTPQDLLRPEINLACALRLLAEFAERYGLDMATERAELFRCWNTGGPYGQTFDPRYAENGLERMKTYAELETGNSKLETGT